MRLRRIAGMLLAVLLLATPSWGAGVDFIPLNAMGGPFTATGNSNAISVAGYPGVGIQVTIAGTATVNFQVAGDSATVASATFNAFNCLPSNSTTQVTSTTASGWYQCNTAGAYFFRINVSICTGCTVTVTSNLLAASIRGLGGGGVPTTRLLNTTSPITGGGDLSADRTLACATCGVTGSPLSQFALTTSLQLLGVISDKTGTGALVFATSPTLVTPLLGTPTSGVATNLTGTAAGLTAGTVTTNANLTGDVTSVGNATTLANTAVAAGTYTNTNLTVDAKGRLTTAASGTGSTVPTGTGFTHITAGVQDAASKTVDVSSADATGVLAAARFPALTGGVTTPSGSLTTTVVTNANLTGPITSTGNATAIASQTGTGTKFVMDTAPSIAGGTSTALTGLGVRSTGTGAFDLKIANAENLTVSDKTLTIQLGDASRTLIIGASPSLSGTNTGDQTITLTGGVTGSGTGSFAATVVTNANLTGGVTSVGNAATVVTNANLTGDVTSVGNATTIGANKVTLGMMATGTAGNLITYSAAGAPVAVATGTAAQVLTSNGAGAAPSMQAVPAAAAGTLTGTTLAANVVTSSLTTIGTLTSLGIGTVPVTNIGLVATPAVTGVSQYAFYPTMNGTSGATSNIVGMRVDASTAAAVSTTTNVIGFQVGAFTLGATSTVTNMYGVLVGATGSMAATNKYGIQTNIAAGTTQWDIHANGGAQNYFNGRVGIGQTVPNDGLDMGATYGVRVPSIKSATGARFVCIDTNGTLTSQAAACVGT